MYGGAGPSPGSGGPAGDGRRRRRCQRGVDRV